MRMIRLIYGYTRMDKISNRAIRDLVKVAPIEDNMRETRLRQLGHVKRSVNTPVRRCERISIPEGKRGRGRPKKSLDKVIREDLKVVGLAKDLPQDRRLWRDRIRILRSQRVSLIVVSRLQQDSFGHLSCLYTGSTDIWKETLFTYFYLSRYSTFPCYVVFMLTQLLLPNLLVLHISFSTAYPQFLSIKCFHKILLL